MERRDREIEWSKENDVLTVKFQDAWHRYSEDGGELKFRITDDGLKFLADGLSAEERKALKNAVLSPGGPSPYQLEDHKNLRGPYARYHRKSALTLDPNEIPVGLAVTGLKVFQCRESEVMTLCRHRQMPRSVLQGLIETSLQVKKINARRIEPPWSGFESVLIALADHPNLEREDLKKLWGLRFSGRTAWVWREARDHAKADPAWKKEFRKRASAKGGEGSRVRIYISRDMDIDLDTIDFLLGFQKSDLNKFAADLANHPKLDADRMRKLYHASPYLTAGILAARDDVPHDILEGIVADGDADGRILSVVLENKSAPDRVRRAAALRLANPHMEKPFCDVAFSCGLLPVKRMRELADHLDLGVRRGLADNPNLPLDLLKRLARDDYRIVAEAARRMCRSRLGSEAGEFLEDLRDLETLKPYCSLEDEMNEVLKKDDPDEFFRLMSGLWDPVVDVIFDFRVSMWRGHAIRYKAWRCLKEWVKRDEKARLMLLDTGLKTLDPEFVDIILSGDPDEEVQAKFILSAVKFGREEWIEEYRKRDLSMKAANTQPLLVHAVFRRNESMIKTLLEMGADPRIRSDGMTPADLAVRLNFTAALKLLPLDENQKSSLKAFREEFPGDPDAAWVGTWTNGKDEFKALALVFSGDGTGVLHAAARPGIPIVWKKESETKVAVFSGDGKAVDRGQKIIGDVKGDTLELSFPGAKTIEMKRAMPKEKP